MAHLIVGEILSVGAVGRGIAALAEGRRISVHRLSVTLLALSEHTYDNLPWLSMKILLLSTPTTTAMAKG